MRISRFKHNLLCIKGFILGILGLRKAQIWDMDGCLANIYEHDDYLDNLSKRKFFLNLNAYYKTIAALKLMMWNHPEYLYGICSKCMDNDWCEIEKDAWMNLYIPEIELRMFVPHNVEKSVYIRKYLKRCNHIVFLDDYTHNLFELEQSGLCKRLVKVRNQINCKTGKWKGDILDTQDVSIEEILFNLNEIMK